MVIVYGIVAKYGYEGLVICTVIAGAILVVLGLARMGALIKFIPYPVVTGFTAGTSVISPRQYTRRVMATSERRKFAQGLPCVG